MNKRVFICGISQESNCFHPFLTQLDKFAITEAGKGKGVLNPGGITVAGMMDVLEEENIDFVPGIIMRAGPAGNMAKEVVEYFLEKTIPALEAAGKLDGVLVSMHGATMAENSNDVCGDIIEKIRQTVGEEPVISVSFDLHANVTEKTMKNADYISGYQTYPHLDLYETGARAAKRLAEHLNGKKSKVAYVKMPLMAPAHGYTTTRGGLGKMMTRAEDMRKSGKIVDYSIFQVQPWLDGDNVASTVIITAQTEDVAKAVAADFAKEEFALRKELQGTPLFEVEEVAQKALKNKTGKPVVLVDSADSPNAGSASDSAVVIEKLLPYKDELKIAVAVTDVPAVKKAFELGVGGIADFTLGATLAPKLTKPTEVKNAKVRSLHNGIFYMHGPQERGQRRNVGKTAILEVGKILIHVAEDGRTEGDRNFYASFGIDPTLCDLVCIKACTSFRAGYEDISAEICNTNTPGAAGPILTELPYERLPKPMYPFEEIDESMISKPKCFR